jgi:predicted Zn-dependent protease
MTRLSSPQEVVEAALGAATADGLVVLVTDRSEANLRWANSSLTTNGEMSSRSVTVIATAGTGASASAGVIGRTLTDIEDVGGLVAEAEAAARAADPAPDAAPLVTPEQAGVGSDFGLEPETTSIGAFAQLATDLGEAFEAGHQHFGFAEHIVDSVYMGSSTGLRLRHVQPTGRLEMNAKNADWSASSYLAFAFRDPGEADVSAANAELSRRLCWAERRLDLPAGRYETILPPTALADLLVEAYWESGARAADEGRSAYSGKLGERLSRLSLELFSDPGRPGMECAPFVVAPASTADTSVFDNGLPVPRQDVLAKGVLVSLTGSRAYAREHDTPVRLESDNLVLEAPGATDSLDDLVAGTTRGSCCRRSGTSASSTRRRCC